MDNIKTQRGFKRKRNESDNLVVSLCFRSNAGVGSTMEKIGRLFQSLGKASVSSSPISRPFSEYFFKHHGLKDVRRAAKKAKIFETQKLVKKLKGLRFVEIHNVRT